MFPTLLRQQAPEFKKCIVHAYQVDVRCVRSEIQVFIISGTFAPYVSSTQMPNCSQRRRNYAR